MPYGDYVILMALGGVFLVLGVGALIWGKREEKGYFDALATRTNDLREFVDHWPPRSQPGSLKVGGYIALAIGVLIVLTGLAFWLWARAQAS